MKFGFAENIDDAIETYICTPETFENLMAEMGEEVRNWCKLHFFSGNSAQALLCSQTNKLRAQQEGRGLTGQNTPE